MVVVEIDELEHTIIEIIGGPSTKKKDAAEHAAEGALWYLKCNFTLAMNEEVYN